MAGLSSFGRTPLAFPAGRAPGFDPSHPAAQGINVGNGFSGVAAAGGFRSLLTGGLGTAAGSPVAAITGPLGPNVNYPAGATHSFSGQSAAGSATATFAAIISFANTVAVNPFFQTNVGGAFWKPETNGNKLTLGLAGVTFTDSTFSIAPGIPYFVAISVTGTTVNFVATTLSNGVIVSSANAWAGGTGATGTNVVGAVNSGNSIAAAMYSPAYLSMRQLQQWAADPFSFWYPRRGVGVASARPVAIVPVSAPAIIARRPISGPRLAYPAGRAPGFDPTHPAARGISVGNGFSGIASGRGFISVLNGNCGTTGGSPTAETGALLGPNINYPAGVTHSFANQSAAGSATATFAVILSFANTAAVNPFFQTQVVGNFWKPETNGNKLTLAIANVTFTDSTFSIAPNVPYFVAISVTGTVVNFIAVTLRNGATVSSANAWAGGTGATGTNIIGAANSGNNIAAAMYAPAYMSMAQLQAWAADPWSFWYPDNRGIYVPSAAAIPLIGSYLTLGSSNNFLFGTSDFTIDFWVNIPAFGANQQLINNGNAADWYFYVSAAGGVRWKNSTGDCCDIAISTGVHHLAVTRASGTTRVFVDGTKSAEFADTSNYGLGSDGPWVGRSP